MADMNVNPTRIELKRLKSRLATAMRGHKLLKDKRDEMTKCFMETVREAAELRRRVENGMERVHSAFSEASAVMSPEVLNVALALPVGHGELFLKQSSIMSISVPSYSYLKDNGAYGSLGYGYAFTSGELDTAVSETLGIVSNMISMAEKEKCVQMLADEIERTRRRVNALEYVMIPRYRTEIRRIIMKLDENERASTTRLMKVKDAMLEEKLERKKAER